MNEILYKDLNAKLLYDFFPEYRDLIYNIDIELGDDVPHSLYGNFFNPLIKNILKKTTNTNVTTAKKIFEFYEHLARSNDNDVKNLLQVTLLEYLWDDYDVYSAAIKFMGINTKILNEEINKYLSQPINNEPIKNKQ